MRFKTNRTIPGALQRFNQIVKHLFFLSLLLTFLGGIWLAGHSFITHGPDLLEQRLSAACNRPVRLERISFKFPNIISLHGLVCDSSTADQLIVRIPRLDCGVSWRLFLGEIRVSSVTLLAPTISTGQLPSLAQLIQQLGRTMAALNFSPEKRQVASLDLRQWPLVIDLNQCRITNGHLVYRQGNNDDDEHAQFEGHFNLHLIFASVDRQALYPESGIVTIRQSSFSHRGLTGTLEGRIELTKNLAQTEFSLLLPTKDALTVKGAVRDYLGNPAAKLSLAANKLSGANFAALQLPFFPDLSPHASIEGSLNLSNVALFDVTLAEVSGNFSLQNTTWRICPLSVTLPNNTGKINATIDFAPDQGRDLAVPASKTDLFARIKLTYQGNNIAVRPFITTLFDKLALPPPAIPSFSAALELKTLADGPAITSILADGSQATLMVDGISDLTLSKLNLTGNLIMARQLVLSGPRRLRPAATVDRDKVIIPISIHGSIAKPAFNFTPS